MAKPAAKAAPKGGAGGDGVDVNDILRFNLRKAAAALGLPSPHAALVAALTREDDPAAPMEELLLHAALGPQHTRCLVAAILARGEGMRAPAYRPLKRLRMLKAAVADEGAAAVAELLRDGCHDGLGVRVEAVELLACEVGLDGCRSLGQALMTGGNSSVVSLVLDCNPAIGDPGVGALCRGLESNRHLQSVSLRYCGVGPAGADSLARVLSSPLSSVECLDLTGNRLGAQGLAVLARAARCSRSLTTLKLGDNGIGAGEVLPAAWGQQHTPSVPAEAAAAHQGMGGHVLTTSHGEGPPTGVGSVAGEGGSAADGATAPHAAPPTSGTPADVQIVAVDSTQAALILLGQALEDVGCPLSSVRIDQNSFQPDDMKVLLPFVTTANKKVTELFVDEMLPRELFVALERTGSIGGRAKKAGKKAPK